MLTILLWNMSLSYAKRVRNHGKITICDKYSDLKNKIPVNGSYWVSNKQMYH